MYFNILEVAAIIQNLSTINYNLYFAAFLGICHDYAKNHITEAFMILSALVIISSLNIKGISVTGDRLLDILCNVCGDRSSGRHYGVYTCDGNYKSLLRFNLHCNN